MPQDVRISPDVKPSYITDMHADGVHVVDGESFTQVSFIHTRLGAHGLYPSRDDKWLFVANRVSHKIHGPRQGAARADGVSAAWPLLGGPYGQHALTAHPRNRGGAHREGWQQTSLESASL